MWLSGNRRQRADKLLKDGKIKEAIHLYQKEEAWDALATAYELGGALELAAKMAERAGLHGKAGLLYKQTGNVLAAMKMFTKHVSSHPDATDICLELGILLEESGQYDEAIKFLQRATRDEQLRKTASMHLGQCFLAKDLYEIAVGRFLACLETGEQASCGNLDVLYNLGKAYQLAGNYLQAKQIYETMLAVDYNYRDVTERLKDVGTLVKVFSDSVKVDSPVPQATILSDNAFQQLSAKTKDRYALKKELGKGGMGTVFLAEDKLLKRRVAIKIILPALAGDDSLRARMIHEAQTAAQIDHPNCVRIFDVGEENGRCYIVMEYVAGRTTRELLVEKGHLDPKECVEILLQVTEGLGYAHKKGITHRDMKPENIIVTEEGKAIIMDFGLAVTMGSTRLTMPGSVCGSLPYMAPEQLRGETELTPAVDIFAVGCIACELLTGNSLFESDPTGAQRMSGQLKTMTKLHPDTPEFLLRVIARCLENEPAKRYADGANLHVSLQEVAGLCAPRSPEES